MRRTLGVAAVAVGILFFVAAGLVKWVAAPRLAVLPGDTDTVRVYAGTAAVMVNPTVISGTRVGPAILRDVPVTVRHGDTVLRTDGSAALVADRRSVAIPGFTVADVAYRFGVDRTDFGPGGSFRGTVPQRGLTFNWPMDTQRRSYTGWVADTQTTTRLQYVGGARHGGVATYVFRTRVAPSPIRDPQLLSLLPRTMTKAQLLEIAPSLGKSVAQLQGMNRLVATLPDPIPLSYTYALDATYWVAPASGVVVDTTHHEVRSVGFVTGAGVVPVGPVMDMTYRATPSTLAAAATDARDAAAKLRLVRTTLPLVAALAGATLTVAGAALVAVRRRRPGSLPPAPVEPRLRIPAQVD